MPGRWHKVAALESNTKIIVYTKDAVKHEVRFQSIIDETRTEVRRDDFRLAGNRVWTGYVNGSEAGVFASLNKDGFLVCRDGSGKRHQIKLETIDRIMLPKTGQYAREWAVWGAVGGAIAGVLISAAALDDFTPTGHVLSSCAGAGIGALGGGITGAATGTYGETVYISKGKALQEAHP